MRNAKFGLGGMFLVFGCRQLSLAIYPQLESMIDTLSVAALFFLFGGIYLFQAIYNGKE